MFGNFILLVMGAKRIFGSKPSMKAQRGYVHDNYTYAPFPRDFTK